MRSKSDAKRAKPRETGGGRNHASPSKSDRLLAAASADCGTPLVVRGTISGSVRSTGWWEYPAARSGLEATSIVEPKNSATCRIWKLG
eukprot:4446382-Prymnesium_polylepis.1